MNSSAISETAPASELLGQGRYQVVGSLGVGSQGETLAAVDANGRAVAIKRFTIRGARSWKEVELAEREAAVLSSLSHPALPHYIEHFEENGALYLVMEKVEGETLAARRQRRAPLDSVQMMRFLREVAACLNYLHGLSPPIVHRDIKPGNVIMRPDGSYCLVDFGSVRDRLKPEGGSTVVGTFGFMAPEQFQGRALPASDVYAVGATAISLLSGRDPEELPHKGLAIDVGATLAGQGLDRRWIVALQAMLEPDPDRRARSVDAALAQAGLAGEQRVRVAAEPGSPANTQGAQFAEAMRRAYSARIEAEVARVQARAERHEQRHERRRERRERQREERAERHRGKAERHAERAARHLARHSHRPGPPVLPGIALGVFLLVALRIASLATFALFYVILPLLFTILPLQHRRARLLAIGHAGRYGLARAREHIRHQFLGGPEPSARGLPATRQRVVDAAGESIEEPDDELEAASASEGRISGGSATPDEARRPRIKQP